MSVSPRSENRPAVLWAARVLVAAVCAWNLSAAIPFVLNPARYAPGFEVSGAGGEALVRGLGVAFLMWQIPFLPVLWNPRRNRTYFLVILAMQAVGLAGESMMMASLPLGHVALRSTGWRFIAFDGAGLALLALAYAVVISLRLSFSPERQKK
jgi:hypothetical protein